VNASARLIRDPIVQIAAAIWLGTAALYFVPGISHDFLERLGDRYNTLPLWPWAAAACVYSFSSVTVVNERRFFILQAMSFVALLAIELPWALERATNSVGWNITAEWCYFVYYGCQLASAARTRAGGFLAVLITAGAASALTVLALTRTAMYDGSWPSYLTYCAFDAGMAVVFWRLRRGASAAWAAIFAALTVTSLIVLATDVLDMFSYEEMLKLTSGMRTDILWTLPPLCYTLVARFGRQRLETAP
jgi:hypothetical protein